MINACCVFDFRCGETSWDPVFHAVNVPISAPAGLRVGLAWRESCLTLPCSCRSCMWLNVPNQIVCAIESVHRKGFVYFCKPWYQKCVFVFVYFDAFSHCLSSVCLTVITPELADSGYTHSTHVAVKWETVFHLHELALNLCVCKLLPPGERQ